MKRDQHPTKLGNLTAAMRVASTASSAQNGDLVRQKRELVADLCRLLGKRMAQVIVPRNGDRHLHNSADLERPMERDEVMKSLSPRMRQTLECLLAGDSEKQIAIKLSLSKHTVHVYVKALYKGFGVCSRGELLARFIQNTSR